MPWRGVTLQAAAWRKTMWSLRGFPLEVCVGDQSTVGLWITLIG